MSNACADKFGMRTESVEAINLQRRILNLIWKIFVERRADSSISSYAAANIIPYIRNLTHVFMQTCRYVVLEETQCYMQ